MNRCDSRPSRRQHEGGETLPLRCPRYKPLPQHMAPGERPALDGMQQESKWFGMPAGACSASPAGRLRWQAAGGGRCHSLWEEVTMPSTKSPRTPTAANAYAGVVITQAPVAWSKSRSNAEGTHRQHCAHRCWLVPRDRMYSGLRRLFHGKVIVRRA